MTIVSPQMPHEQKLTQPLTTAPMGLFPTLNSLQEVLDLAHSQLPVERHNQMTALILTYHNTLLRCINASKSQSSR